MNNLFGKIGRYVFAIPFGIFGIFHFMNGSAMAGMVPIPGGVFWIYLTGAALLAASLSIMIEQYTRLACILLGIMLIIFVLSIHLPGVMSGEMQPSMTNLLKDLALAGGAWILAGNYGGQKSGATAGPGLE
ncbi:DoxX family protein [Balneolaceae bacterium YR4-1]|uniref:DoxX family protein n=1 Tax=Halalkalibaculum roseum TaxID=2709311 RepID=A0A6M1SRA2_9BACT|nr:DoxX family protein [Halalkalibaculum roseum]NGP77941.1 DoxX family protein [Halalkalibaculum roseum]